MTELTWYDLQKTAETMLAGVAGVGAGYALRSLVGRWQANSIEKRAQTHFEEMGVEVKNRLKEADILARAEVVKAREDFEKTTKSRRKELQDIEDRLLTREEHLDRKHDLIEKKELALNQRQSELQARDAELAVQQQGVERAAVEAQARLQTLAGRSRRRAWMPPASPAACRKRLARGRSARPAASSPWLCSAMPPRMPAR